MKFNKGKSNLKSKNKKNKKPAKHQKPARQPKPVQQKPAQQQKPVQQKPVENNNSNNVNNINNRTDNAKTIWNFFIDQGFTKECTAGIMGNLKQESQLEPDRFQSNGGPGRGIAQWTVDQERFEGLKAHAAKKGKDWTDLQSQLEWIILELQGEDWCTLNILKQHVGGYEQFKKVSSVIDACTIFEDAFERAEHPYMESRYKYANEIYEMFK